MKNFCFKFQVFLVFVLFITVSCKDEKSTVKNNKTNSFKIFDEIDKKFENIRMYKLTVRDEDGEVLEEDIQVCHEDSFKDFDRIANKIKSKAIKEKSAKHWVSYYDFLKNSANLNYGYALTVHKSQGSTYDNVFLIESDLNFNRNIVERNRIKYTGYTRCSKKLIVVS